MEPATKQSVVHGQKPVFRKKRKERIKPDPALYNKNACFFSQCFAAFDSLGV